MNPTRLVTIALAAVMFVTPLFAKQEQEKEAVSSRCSLAHYPVAVGDTNEYRMTSNQFDAEKQILNTTSYTYRDEIMSVEDDRFRMKSIGEGNTTESEWACSDEGLDLIYDEYPDTTITTTGVTIPAQMEVDGVWNQTFESESPGSSQKSTTVNRITRREEVVVPAGTFDAYRVDYETETIVSEQAPSYVRGTQWFAPGFGIVKSTSAIDMEAGEIHSIETTIELMERISK